MRVVESDGSCCRGWREPVRACSRSASSRPLYLGEAKGGSGEEEEREEEGRRE
jgi:hypothetical protein